MEEFRIVERKENENWVKVNHSELKKGDVFRMFEPTGEPVLWIDDLSIFTALSDAYIDEKFNQWTIEI